MKFTKLFLAAVVVCQGIVIAGCDDETHPDPRLVESMNAQRQAQQPGQQQQPPKTEGQ